MSTGFANDKLCPNSFSFAKAKRRRVQAEFTGGEVSSDGGFRRWRLWCWCEGRGVDWIVGIARNARLEKKVEDLTGMVERIVAPGGQPHRALCDLPYIVFVSGLTWEGESRTEERTNLGGAHWSSKGCMIAGRRVAPALFCVDREFERPRKTFPSQFSPPYTHPMPEGDTIHKLALAIAPLLEGERLTRAAVDAQPAPALVGPCIASVTARGKHLLIAFDNGQCVRSHLGMYGSWHRYAPDEIWRKGRRRVSLELETERDLLICFNAREVELLRVAGVRKRVLDARLGPDLAEEGSVLEPVSSRARDFLHADTPLVDVLLDQRVACGIGNVYKSELLFLEGWHPLTPLGSLDDTRLLALYWRAADLLRRNLGPGPRVTRRQCDPGGRLWVYRRRGLPCLRCGSLILAARLGRLGRSTYWCPCCQARGTGSDPAD